MPKKEKVIVGMSGGVDSSMAMYLLQKAGYEPVGDSLKYDVWDDPANTIEENVCCSDESFQIAKHVCDKLGIKHYIIDVRKKFKKEIVDYFKSELKAKRTPNPCVICNRVLKFTELLEFAKKEKAKYVATGHYAQISKSDDEYFLTKSNDPKKDQTYSLSFLKKEWLRKIIFPLGKYNKDQVYEMAQEAGFGFYLYRKQSQDWCYVSDKAMKAFLEKEIGIHPGNIIDSQGNILGKHNGLHFYTIGQRKGVEIPNGPWFVTGMNPQKNELIVTKLGTSPSLFKKEVILEPYNLLIKPFKKSLKVEAKIRYAQELSKATLYPPKNNQIRLVFTEPQRAITLGQFAVFYKGKKCLGSGRIMEAN